MKRDDGVYSSRGVGISKPDDRNVENVSYFEDTPASGHNGGFLKVMSFSDSSDDEGGQQGEWGFLQPWVLHDVYEQWRCLDAVETEAWKGRPTATAEALLPEHYRMTRTHGDNSRSSSNAGSVKGKVNVASYMRYTVLYMRRGVPDRLKRGVWMLASEALNFHETHPSFYKSVLEQTFGQWVPETVSGRCPTFCGGFLGLQEDIAGVQADLSDLEFDQDIPLATWRSLSDSACVGGQVYSSGLRSARGSDGLKAFFQLGGCTTTTKDDGGGSNKSLAGFLNRGSRRKANPLGQQLPERLNFWPDPPTPRARCGGTDYVRGREGGVQGPEAVDKGGQNLIASERTSGQDENAGVGKESPSIKGGMMYGGCEAKADGYVPESRLRSGGVVNGERNASTGSLVVEESSEIERSDNDRLQVVLPKGALRRPGEGPGKGGAEGLTLEKATELAVTFFGRNEVSEVEDFYLYMHGLHERSLNQNRIMKESSARRRQGGSAGMGVEGSAGRTHLGGMHPNPRRKRSASDVFLGGIGTPKGSGILSGFNFSRGNSETWAPMEGFSSSQFSGILSAFSRARHGKRSTNTTGPDALGHTRSRARTPIFSSKAPKEQPLSFLKREENQPPAIQKKNEQITYPNKDEVGRRLEGNGRANIEAKAKGSADGGELKTLKSDLLSQASGEDGGLRQRMYAMWSRYFGGFLKRNSVEVVDEWTGTEGDRVESTALVPGVNVDAAECSSGRRRKKRWGRRRRKGLTHGKPQSGFSNEVSGDDAQRSGAFNDRGCEGKPKQDCKREVLSVQEGAEVVNEDAWATQEHGDAMKTKNNSGIGRHYSVRSGSQLAADENKSVGSAERKFPSLPKHSDVQVLMLMRQASILHGLNVQQAADTASGVTPLPSRKTLLKRAATRAASRKIITGEVEAGTGTHSEGNFDRGSFSEDRASPLGDRGSPSAYRASPSGYRGSPLVDLISPVDEFHSTYREWNQTRSIKCSPDCLSPAPQSFPAEFETSPIGSVRLTVTPPSIAEAVSAELALKDAEGDKGGDIYAFEQVTDFAKLLDTRGHAAAKRLLWCMYSMFSHTLEFCPVIPHLTCLLLLYFDEAAAFSILYCVVKHSRDSRETGRARIFVATKRVEFVKIVSSAAELLRGRMPRVYRHLHALRFDLAAWTARCMQSFFTHLLPFDFALRIAGLFLTEGTSVLYRYTFALIKHLEHRLLSSHDLGTVERILYECSADPTLDIDNLTKVAFKYQDNVHDLLGKATAELSSPYLLSTRMREFHWPKARHISKILRWDVDWKLIWEWLPPICKTRTAELVYTSTKDGLSVTALQRKLAGCLGMEFLFVIETAAGDVLGLFAPYPLHILSIRHCDVPLDSAFVFTIKPQEGVYWWAGKTKGFMTVSSDAIIIGTNDVAIYLDGNLRYGESRASSSFASPPLVHDPSGSFETVMVEGWVLSPT